MLDLGQLLFYDFFQNIALKYLTFKLTIKSRKFHFDHYRWALRKSYRKKSSRKGRGKVFHIFSEPPSKELEIKIFIFYCSFLGLFSHVNGEFWKKAKNKCPKSKIRNPLMDPWRNFTYGKSDSKVKSLC